MVRRKRLTKLTCSFCGKGAADVAKIIPGQDGAICDECIRVANELLDEGGIPTTR